MQNCVYTQLSGRAMSPLPPVWLLDPRSAKSGNSTGCNSFEEFFQYPFFVDFSIGEALVASALETVSCEMTKSKSQLRVIEALKRRVPYAARSALDCSMLVAVIDSNRISRLT